MVPFAYFGINSSALSLVVDLLILFLAVIYVALIYWTFNDARRRIEDPLLVGCAFVISFFPFVGPLVYTILRPPEYIEDARERELEVRAAEARLAQLDYGLCPHCDYRIERDFVRCPSCLRKLKERCSGCARPLDPAWAICPYCETEVPAAASPTRERRSGRQGGGTRSAARSESQRAERSRARERARERETKREDRKRLGKDATKGAPDPATDSVPDSVPDVTLVDEALLDAESLLSAEEQLVRPGEEQLIRRDEDEPVPASESGPGARGETRRTRRSRPSS